MAGTICNRHAWWHACLVALGLLATVAAAADFQFEGIQPALTPASKHQIITSPSVTIDGVTSQTPYNVLYRSGDTVGDLVIGQMLDMEGNPVKALDWTTGEPEDGGEVDVYLDHTSLLQIGCSASDRSVRLVNQFEGTPAMMYSMEVQQDPANGTLSVVNPTVVDFSRFGGLWAACAGSISPWQTHLGSEEYEPDAKVLDQAESIEDILAYEQSGIYIIRQMRYFNMYLPNMTVDDVKTMFKPYLYGRVTEVAVDQSGCTQAVKHLAMGRGSIEMALVLADNRTVLISEDGETNGPLYRFVADRAGDLSAGTLYAAKFNQTSSEGPGSFDVSWIELGHGSDEALYDAATTLSFSDIFDLIMPAEDEEGCPQGYTSVNTNYAGHECLRLKEGMEEVAPFLETRRYAAMLGATTELQKAEGLAYDREGNRVFMAISAIEKGMEDFAKRGEENPAYDFGGNNDIRLEWQPCGCVYQLDLDADLIPVNMKPLVCGVRVNETENYGNGCSLDSIANPDNIEWIDGANTLLIAEDSSYVPTNEDLQYHTNSVMWAYNLDSGNMTRILSSPYGAEVSSVKFYPNINGYGYLMAVVMHPYGESDYDKAEEPEATGTAAYLGYMGPLKNAGAAIPPFCNDNAGICA